ncbi:MAG: nitronate monooxygenase [Algiphilus sp.]|uniref:NAD(P)H-dependent flavin oxidoreductase n=1 Tax=Algiphilus sp. TaxID=1872431 RepID=UPI0032EFB982
MSTTWTQALGLRWPVVQAALGGGISTADLAIAVSRAGGLGTIGLMPETQFADEIKRAQRELDGLPFAANLLMPLLRRGHLRACIEQRVPVVSVFFGHDAAILRELKEAGCYVIYQVGDIAEADTVLRDGADALIVQGNEAGGHVRSTQPLAALLPAVRHRHPEVPILAAGGIFDAASVSRARAMGADGVAAGTRFLLTPESNAHDDYKQALLEARETLLTDLFGFGWNAPHRVVPNAATRSWCRKDAQAPRWLSGMNSLFEAPSRLLPLRAGETLIRWERPSLPFFGPFPLTRQMPADRREVAPLYAGACVAEMTELRPAADVVRELGEAFANAGA